MIALATPPQWCQPATGAFRFSEPCLLSPGVLLASGPAACPLPVGSAIAEPCTSAVCVQRGSELQHGVLAAVPEDNTVSVDPSPASLELVTCLLIFGLLAVVLLVCRVYRSIQSRLYVVREQKLALELSVLLKEKCKLLEQVSLAQKEYEALESSLKEANFDKASTDAQSLEATYKNLERDKSQSGDELLILEKKLEERTKHREQDELLFQEAEVRKEKADQGNELLIVTVLQNSTVPNSPPAEWKTPGPVLVPPPVPQDRSPRDPPFAGDPRRPPPLPPPPPGNIYAGPPAYFPPRDFIGPPFRSYPGQPRTDVALQRQDRFYSKSGRRSGRRKHTICKMPTLLEVDEPESSAEPSTENDNKSDPGNSTVPNTPAAECKTPGPGFIPPPVPQDRGPRGPPFAGDPRRPPPLMPHPAGNIYGSPPDFFPTRDFVGPPYPPYPGQPYCDNFLQRQDRFYSESGRLPGRRHHGNYNTPHLLESDEPELSAMPPSKSDNKSDRCNSTVPATPPAECKTPGPGFIPPPVPLDRGPRGPPFAWDPRRPPPFPPPPPGNIYEGRPDYFPPRDFPGPPFPPYPGQPYSDAALQWQDRFYPESGRLPGSRQHGNYNMPPLLDLDEPEWSAVPSTKNDNKGNHNNSTVPNTPAECKTPGPGFVPPPVPLDRGPRGPPFAWDPRRPPPYPPPPPGNIYGGPPHYLPPVAFAGPPYPPYPGQPYCDSFLQSQERFYSESGRHPHPRHQDESESSVVTSTKNDNKSDHSNSTVPNTPPAGCKTPGPGFIPPPVPLDRGPRGPPFAWDPRRPHRYPPPPPGNIYGVPPHYFPPMDFAGPPFPPYPGQPYCDSFLQSQERFYSESGRHPRPRHHGNYYMPSSSDMDKPESSAVPSTVNDMKNDHSNSTVPNTPAAECKTPGPGFIPPPVPQDRGPRGPPCAWDPRRPPRYPPPPPANNYGGPEHYFPPMDFDGPPFLPYPGRNMCESRGFPPFLPLRAGFFPHPHIQRGEMRDPRLDSAFQTTCN